MKCSVNDVSFDDLFQFYNDSGFLYDAKMQRLLPFLNEVKSNWQKSIQSQNVHRLFWSEIVSEGQSPTTATLSAWRTTFGGWHVSALGQIRTRCCRA